MKSKWPRIKWNQACAELANEPFKDIFNEMTQDQPTIEADYRIHWRDAAGKTGHETGLYSEDEANTWVAALNRDPSKQGRVYWAEPVTKSLPGIAKR